jgi:hypothetical protein
MLDLVELAASGVGDLTDKRRRLAEDLAMLDAVIEQIRQAEANPGVAERTARPR